MTERAAPADGPGRHRTGRGDRAVPRTGLQTSRVAGDRHPVVAGYDGSSASIRALAYAAGMARRLDGWLVVVHVWRGGGAAFVPLAERMRWLRDDLADADLVGLDVEMIVRCGDPAKELGRVTAERGADAIVIGAAGRSRRRLAGSVPAWLARHAGCPAVIVP